MFAGVLDTPILIHFFVSFMSRLGNTADAYLESSRILTMELFRKNG